jgi:ABC-type sulfate transport system substrate-binding protein
MGESIASRLKSRNWRQKASWGLGAVLLLMVAFYAGRTILVNAHAPVKLVVYAFSTQEEVFTQGIFPAFEEAWEAETGRDLTIEGVFGPSGTLAGQINLGAPADVAFFSNAQHATWLKVGRRVQMKTQPVTIGCTPMVVVTRPGNPFGITEFADLGQPGLQLLHADPQSSGAGDWAVLAEYGSALFESDGQATAEEQLKSIWRNVRLLAPSARATLTLFELGAGDALVTYEQEALLALERGVALEIVIPSGTIVAHHVAVVVDDNVTLAERPVTQAFLNYLLDETGQRILRQYYLRPVACDGYAFRKLVRPFTVEDLGGWSRAYTELVETLWEKEIKPHLNLEPAPRLPGTGE